MNKYNHPELVNDLALIAQTMTESEFVEFYECYLGAIKTAIKDPYATHKELERELTGWYRELYFSTKKRPKGQSPNMRLIYRYDNLNDDLYILGTGYRNAKSLNSVYNILKSRDMDSWIKDE